MNHCIFGHKIGVLWLRGDVYLTGSDLISCLETSAENKMSWGVCFFFSIFFLSSFFKDSRSAKLFLAPLYRMYILYLDSVTRPLFAFKGLSRLSSHSLHLRKLCMGWREDTIIGDLKSGETRCSEAARDLSLVTELAEAGLELWRQLCSPPHQASSTQVWVDSRRFQIKTQWESAEFSILLWFF